MADTNPGSDSKSAGASGSKPAVSFDAKPAVNESQAAHSLESVAMEPDPENPKSAFGSLLSLEGWRGLAHYRTESRRKVVKKKPEERTASDLYVLEESVKNAKLISDLPLAKRLEVCKYLGYEVWDENQHVYEQGAEGSIFYVLFTGLVRASVCEEGVQEPRTKVILPGDCFGELALLSEEMIMADTAFTTERCELLTLTRVDYDKILKIEKTPEMKERVKFLKHIEAFRNVSKQSLQRLANVMNSRTYSKNKVITFQGDEAFEMFFIKSGECRIIMEITSVKRPVLRLPRVSTFVYLDSPTIHHKCKLEALQKEKDYGRPSLISRSSQRSLSRLQIPTGLPDVLLNSPDLIHELALGHARSQKAAKNYPPVSRPQSRLGSALSKSASKRPSSSKGKNTKLTLSSWDSLKGTVDDQLPQVHNTLAQTVSFVSSSSKVRELIDEDKQIMQLKKPSSPSVEGATKIATPRDKEIQPVSFVSSSSKVRELIDEDKQIMQLKKPSSPSVEGATKIATPRDKEIQRSSYVAKRRSSSFVQKYTLDTFLSEVEAKEREVKDIDFSEKDHALWHMGMSQGAMKSGFSEDVKYYRNKFQKWARGVLDRERMLFGFNVYDNQQESPSFTKGAARQHIMRLDQGSGPQSINRKIEKDAMILDIGALQAGDYFGERGLLKKTRRAVSIVTTCPVEVLVLNVWDFHRHCDRDIMTALGANDYKKEEQIYKQYLKNCRWEQFKKKCLDDIVDRQNYNRCLRLGPRGMRFIPKGDILNPAAPPRTEWK